MPAAAPSSCRDTTPVTSGTILDAYGAFPSGPRLASSQQRPATWWPQADAPTSNTEEFELQIIPKH